MSDALAWITGHWSLIAGCAGLVVGATAWIERLRAIRELNLKIDALTHAAANADRRIHGPTAQEVAAYGSPWRRLPVGTLGAGLMFVLVLTSVFIIPAQSDDIERAYAASRADAQHQYAVTSALARRERRIRERVLEIDQELKTDSPHDSDWPDSRHLLLEERENLERELQIVTDIQALSRPSRDY